VAGTEASGRITDVSRRTAEAYASPAGSYLWYFVSGRDVE
jgi:hypothetical protein